MFQAAVRLTKYQQHLVSELEDITSLLRLDYHEIAAYDADARTTLLELMRRKFIISEVVTQYTLVDEYLNAELCHYFFGRKRSFIELWKTKRFKLFNYHVIEELSLMAKLRFARSTGKVPKPVAADIERLNAMRNGLAHAFFPENLKKSRPEWKGKKIFEIDGLQAFLEDMRKVGEHFSQRLPEGV